MKHLLGAICSPCWSKASRGSAARKTCQGGGDLLTATALLLNPCCEAASFSCWLHEHPCSQKHAPSDLQHMAGHTGFPICAEKPCMFNAVFTTSSSQGEVLAEGLTDDTKERATVQHLQKGRSVNTSATVTDNSLTQHCLHYGWKTSCKSNCRAGRSCWGWPWWALIAMNTQIAQIATMTPNVPS